MLYYARRYRERGEERKRKIERESERDVWCSIVRGVFVRVLGVVWRVACNTYRVFLYQILCAFEGQLHSLQKKKNSD